MTEPTRSAQRELRVVDTRRWSRWSVKYNALEPLIDIYPDDKAVPLLVTSWQWIDDRTLEMSLRQGVTFQNGGSFNAEIVNLNWDEQINSLRDYWGSDLIWWAFPKTARLDIIDADTIRLVLPAHDAQALIKLNIMLILNRAFFQRVAERARQRNSPRGRWLYSGSETTDAWMPWETWA